MYSIIRKIQKYFDLFQGIGYGTASIDQELSSFKKYVSNGKIFIDAGGNKGSYTDGILKFYRPNEIHIFEPSNSCIQLLRKKFENNKSIIINHCGLSDTNSSTKLYSDNSGSGMGSLSKRRLEHFGIDFSVEEDIEVIRFDDYWKNNYEDKYIDLFKMDVEGHELNVLDGIGGIITKIRIIQFEFGGCNIDTRTYFQDYWYFFKQHNFKIFRITPFGNIEIKYYSESDERFQTTNYFCVNQNLL